MSNSTRCCHIANNLPKIFAICYLSNHNSQITIHKSQFTNHNSQITIHNSQFTSHNSQVTIHNNEQILHITHYKPVF
jgi:hypothetical protein